MYYIDSEPNFRRFTLLVLRFISTIIILIYTATLEFSLVGWDGLGLTSFLLVIYYKSRRSLGSGIITALTNRLGDCFFILILGLVFRTSVSGAAITLLLIILRITKRAQIPFSAWLPAAMAAPTPVSALVHSSTLVTAGVYILIRYSAERITPIILIGTGTIIIAGLRGCVEGDIKKVVALSTLSQLGVMIVALGCAHKSLCFFHLVSHAIFKALLFMAVGTMIHSIYGGQEYRSFRKIGILLTPATFLLASNISLIGLPFLRGFYSKDAIYEYLAVNRGPAVLFLIGVLLTAAYSVKIFIRAASRVKVSRPPSTSLGALSFQLKYPIITLGIFSIIWGQFIRIEGLPISLVIEPGVKTLTIKAVVIGIIIGSIISIKVKSNNNPLGRISLLAPRTQ